MGYYMGDYYGRRYPRMGRGDPGFFSFLGNLAKSAVGFIPGVGPIAKGAIEGISSIVGKKAGKVIVPSVVDTGRGIIKSGTSIIKKHPVLTGAGAAGAAGLAGAAIEHHLMTRGGGRRHRRMNPCNPKALRKAIRRTHAFAKLAMKTIHLVHPKKKARFGGFRKRKAKR
jgi:hypothetical protein